MYIHITLAPIRNLDFAENNRQETSQFGSNIKQN